MNEQAVLEVVRAVAPYVFVLLLGFVFRATIREKIIPNVTSIEGLGFKIGLVAQKLDKAVQERRSEPSMSLAEPDPFERDTVLRRTQRLAPIVQGARLLWIDPNPGGNRYEIELMRSLGIGVDLARSGEDADELLRAATYDVVISNVRRPEKVKGKQFANGIEFLQELREELNKEGVQLPRVVFYVMNLNPTIDTSLALGITNRPDQLLHFVLDAIERSRS